MPVGWASALAAVCLVVRAADVLPGMPPLLDAGNIYAAAAPGKFAPENGQTFLQVTAVGRDEADALADVLSKKGFHAHSVAKPGNLSLYRVLVGPVKDTAELSSTRDELRKTGFRDVIVQRY